MVSIMIISYVKLALLNVKLALVQHHVQLAIQGQQAVLSFSATTSAILLVQIPPMEILPSNARNVIQIV